MSGLGGDSGLRTDACPSPPRDEEEIETENIDNLKEPASRSEPEKSPKEGPRIKTKTGRRPKNFFTPPAACVINLKNATGVHFGNNLTINVNSRDKEKERAKEEVIKTQQIMNLLDCKDLLEKQHILFVATHVAEGWRDIGRYLDYSEGQIDQFYQNHHTFGIKEVAYKLLLDWIQVNPKSATLGRLGNILWKSDQKDAARRLAKKVFEDK